MVGFFYLFILLSFHLRNLDGAERYGQKCRSPPSYDVSLPCLPPHPGGERATSCPSLVKILAPYLSPPPLSLSLLRVDVISGPPPRKRSVGGRDPAGRTSSFLLPNQHFGSLEPQRTTDASAIKSGEQRGDARFPPQLAAGRGDPLEELKKTRASHFFFLFVLFSRFLFRLASFSFSTLGPKLAHCSQSLLPSSLGEDQGGVGRTGEG